MNKDQDSLVAGSFRPELIHTFLPGCKECGSAHPLARKPIQKADVCPDCGATVSPPGHPQIESAVLTGLSVPFPARVLLSIGKMFHNLANRI